MATKEEMAELASEIAKLLPLPVVVSAVGRAIEQALSSMTGSYGSDDITRMVKEAVAQRARELLRTKYKEQLEERAQLLAAQMVGEMVNYRMRDR